MNKVLLLTLQSLIVTPAYAGFADEIAKSFFEKKVEQLQKSALKCSPLEKDPKSKMDVDDWMKIRPELPEWQMMAGIEETANEARKYATSIGGNDKIRHCLAGCYIAKKLDYKSAVLVGWMKELQDASDCNKNTRFEKKDYEVTILGARAGASEKTCDQLCRK